MAADAAPRPPTIDPHAADRWLLSAPPVTPWLHEEIGRRMEERLQWIKRQPETWADWAPVRGGQEAHALVARRYPKAACYVVEAGDAHRAVAQRLYGRPGWSPRRWLGAPVEFGEPPAGTAQLLWSNMALHLAADPGELIRRWHASIATDGFLMFSCLGPDTLRELRALYTALGWPSPGHEFTDMHDWGDMLVAAGFAEPVMDMERVVLTWDSPEALLAELRGLGRNLHPARFGGLRGRGWRQRLLAALAARLVEPTQGGRLALTFEVIYGHAFKAAPRVPLATRSEVSLDEMRSLLRQGRTGPRVPGQEPEV